VGRYATLRRQGDVREPQNRRVEIVIQEAIINFAALATLLYGAR